jgi:hypothetical protein
MGKGIQVSGGALKRVLPEKLGTELEWKVLEMVRGGIGQASSWHLQVSAAGC